MASDIKNSAAWIHPQFKAIRHEHGYTQGVKETLQPAWSPVQITHQIPNQPFGKVWQPTHWYYITLNRHFQISVKDGWLGAHCGISQFSASVPLSLKPAEILVSIAWEPMEAGKITLLKGGYRVPRKSVPKLLLGHKGTCALSFLGNTHRKSQDSITTVA